MGQDRQSDQRKQMVQIEYPSLQEKEQSIAYIVAQGVPKPQKLGTACKRILEAVGLQGLFFGVWDCILLAFFIDGVLWAAVYGIARRDAGWLYLLAFLASPVLYGLLHLLTVWKVVMAGTYQILAVCRLSLRQMTALRLLLFGGAAAVSSGLLNFGIGMCLGGVQSAIRAVCLSVSALFFYAWIQLFAESRRESLLAYAAAPTVWCAASSLLLMAGAYGQQILERIPMAALLVCAGCCVVLYLGTLREYCFQNEEGLCYQ